MEDEDRLDYIIRNQSKLRAEYIQGVFDAIEKGIYDASQIGKKVLLPSSHVGSRRYIVQNYHDGIAICCVYGPPDLFITFTCNPKWSEITSCLLPDEHPNDRPDIIARVFHMKLRQLLDDLHSGKIFGPILALLFLISVEIPDPEIDPLGYTLVAEHMMHGSCGEKNWNCPCMKKGKCSKFYPKDFVENTTFSENGFIVYRRRNNGIFIRREQHNLDNRWVVPHNLILLKRYQAHINVENVNQSRVLKYLCKYVNKGPDRAKETDTIDEIQEYLDCRLPVHLPLMNIVKMKSDEKLAQIAKDLNYAKTMLTEWFTANKEHEDARELTYYEFPRKQRGFKIGRLYYVNPAEGEIFYLRMLLMIVKEACAARGLLDDDKEWYHTYQEATNWATSFQLRNLFVIMLTYCQIKDEKEIFNATWHTMQCLLEELKELFSKNGQEINAYNLPKRYSTKKVDNKNRLIQEEMNCDTNIVNSVLASNGNFNFVSGHGGTGKTFLWNAIVSYLRARKKIILTIASAGVASLLLPNGQTAHSRFRIPIDLDQLSMCDIKRGTNLAKFLIDTDLIIWDEALMTNKQCFEALDRSLRDIVGETNEKALDTPFGGKVVVLGGDTKQILPVIENGTKEQIIDASIVTSYLWSHTNILFLSENMRLRKNNISKEDYEELVSFNNWIFAIENGQYNNNNDNASDSTLIEIPKEFLIQAKEDKIQALVESTYPNLQTKYIDPDYIKKKTILAITNDRENTIVQIAYLNATDTPNDANILYPVEYLNTLNANNFPPHRLELKIGTPVMLLRNQNQNLGQCNGTRIMITQLGDTVIEGTIITGTHVGEKTHIPCINLTTKGNRWPFTLCRRQFPIKGQTLTNVGLYLKKKVFTHGQLYVAVSRVTEKRGLKILIENDDGSCGTVTENIVYK
ncbi:hypothetical protein BS78_07G158400 [Paspalum vaginatum]|nr:hypothetical protein BS78_07G158400 [Paspalum vaginatum]